MTVIVPFADLHKQYLSIKPEIDEAIRNVITNSSFVRGPHVTEFEKNFSKLVGVDHCVSCGNGTDALYIAMKCLGLKPGMEVVTTAHSWISTSETISQAGGTPVFVDTDKESYTINVEKIEAKITQSTVGIIPVHLYGQPADMDGIQRVAKKYNLWIIEDCAQAHLAEFEGRMVGTFGDASTFSFYPGKNLGAMGDAGAVVTNNEDLSIKMAMYSRHGGLKKGDHIFEGINSRLDGIQAAILNVKMQKLVTWTDRRIEIAAIYDVNIKNDKLIKRSVSSYKYKHVYHLYVIECENRDELKNYLASKNIESVINYPVALPFLPAYNHLKCGQSEFTSAFAAQNRILSIPIFPEMSDEQIEYVVDALNDF